MKKNNVIYRGLRVVWLFVKRIMSYISYIPYYLHKPELIQKDINDPKLIVSFTTYPDRVKCLPLVVGSIVRQSKQPDAIMLYLSKKQFDNTDGPIFDTIRKQGVMITLVDDDIRSHQNYFYAMELFPDSVIITIDDDIIYDKNMVKDLYNSYLKHPKAVSAKRVHRIKFGKDNKVLPYLSWDYNIRDIVNEESLELVATGCAGILYPPNCLYKEWNDIEGIKKTSLCADDLWLKVMELLNNVPVVLVKSESSDLKHIWGTDSNGLGINNILNSGNDLQLENICEYKNVNIYELINKGGKY